MYEDVDSWLSPASSPVEGNQTSSSKRDSGILSSCESEEAGNCIEVHTKMNQASTPFSNLNTDHSSPIYGQRASPEISAATTPCCHNHGNSARLVPYKSMELLTSDAINDISMLALCDSEEPSPPPTLSVSPIINKPENAALCSPTIPKRSSSLLKSNKLITDKELIKQGQRLSQVLNLTPVPKRKVSLAMVKDTVAKFLKHRSSTDTMKVVQSSPPNATQANRVFSKNKRNLRQCSASTTSLQNSHQVDTASNHSCNHLCSWVGSSVNLHSSAPVRRSSQGHPQHSSHPHASTYVSSFYRRAASVNNLCDVATYSQECCGNEGNMEGAAYFRNYSPPCSTSARMWYDSDGFEDSNTYESMQSPKDERGLKNFNEGNEYININDYNPQEEQENGYRNTKPSSCQEEDEEQDEEQEEEYVDFDPLLDEECEYKNIVPLLQEEEEDYVDFDKGSDYEKMSHKEDIEDDEEEYLDFDPQKAEKLEFNCLKSLTQKKVYPELKKENEHANIGLSISHDMYPWKALSRFVSQDNSDDDLQVNEDMPQADKVSEDGYTEMKHWVANKEAVPIVDRLGMSMGNNQVNVAEDLEEEKNYKTVSFSQLKRKEQEVDCTKVYFNTHTTTSNTFPAKFQFHPPPPNPPSFAPLLLSPTQEREMQEVLEDKEEQCAMIAFHTDDEIGKEKVHEKMAEKKNPKLFSNRFQFNSLYGNPSDFFSTYSLSSQVRKLSTAQLCQPHLTNAPQSPTNKQIRRWSHANLTSNSRVNSESLSKMKQASEFQLRRSAPLTRKNMSKIHSSWLRTSGLGPMKNVNL